MSGKVKSRQNADTSIGNSLQAIHDAIDNGYVYAGIATPTGTPVSGKVFYLAVTAGTYTNFGGLVVPQGINILKYDGSAWSLEQVVGIDNEPTPNSDNLVKSGGVEGKFSELSMHIGYFLPNGSFSKNGGFDFTDLIEIPSNIDVRITHAAALGTTLAPIALYKADGTFLRIEKVSEESYVNRVVTITSQEFASYVSLGAKYFIVQHSKNYDPLLFTIIDAPYTPINIKKANFNGINILSFINANTNTINAAVADISRLKEVVAVEMHDGYFRPDGELNRNASFNYTDFIEIESNGLTINHVAILGATGAAIALYDSNGKFIKVEKTSEQTPQDTEITITANEFNGYKTNDGAAYFIVQHMANKQPLQFSRTVKTVNFTFFEHLQSNPIAKPIYVSTAGNDLNSGSKSYPVKTLQEALKRSDYIIILNGNYIIANPSSITAYFRKVKISSPNSEKAILKFGKELTVTYNSTTGFYETENVAFDTDLVNFVLYNDGTPDEDTRIADADRHPSQRGRQFRCMSTAYFQVADAQHLSNKKFYYDGSKFIIQSTVSLTKIWMPPTTWLNFADCDVEFNNVDILYADIWLQRCFFKMTDCSVMYGCSTRIGGITYYCSSINLTRCEVARKYQCDRPITDKTGDGICGTWTGTTLINERNLAATLIDCWCHDNQDDGFSDHGPGVNTIIGGLYEYNVKAGVVPAAGIKSTCIGVTCRKQQWGFAHVNALTTLANKVFQGSELVDCLATDNESNYYLSPDSIVCVYRNCQSENAEDYGYQVSEGSVLHLYDCVSSNDTNVKTGNIITHNGSVVS